MAWKKYRVKLNYDLCMEIKQDFLMVLRSIKYSLDPFLVVVCPIIINDRTTAVEVRTKKIKRIAFFVHLFHPVEE